MNWNSMIFVGLVVDISIGSAVRANNPANNLRMHPLCHSVPAQVETCRWRQDGAIKCARTIAAPFNHLVVIVAKFGADSGWLDNHEVVSVFVTSWIGSSFCGSPVKTTTACKFQ